MDESDVVKVANFGMAKDVYGLQPIRWMAVESLEDDKFTSKSDVVS